MSVRRNHTYKGLRTRHLIFLWLRVILGLIVSISLIIIGYIWILSVVHAAPGEWSIILPIAFTVLSVVFTSFQLFFPVSPISEKQAKNNVTLIDASELYRENLNLGDDAAAKFQYIVDPVQDAYNFATQLLHNISSGTKVSNQGFLIIGESNAGKTRLALEAISSILPKWLVLPWNPSYSLQDIPDSQSIANKKIVIFIDDIQKYVSMESIPDPSMDVSSIKVEIIHVLLNRLRKDARQVIVIATCREEDETKARAKVNHLFESLKVIRIRRFNPDPQSDEAKNIINQFESKGAKHSKDWDGTIGSLILGLSRKKSLYNNLVLYEELTAIILKAMKLLTSAEITTHTERRLKAVSAKVFGAKELLHDEKTWRIAVARLKQLQFVSILKEGSELVLVIRKDSYFEKVINDYSKQDVEQDFDKLLRTLVDLKDARALTNLSHKYFTLALYEDALDALDQSLAINPDNALEWYLKGCTLGILNQPEKALLSFEKALNIDPHFRLAWKYNGLAYSTLKMYREALQAFNNYLASDDEDSSTWTYKGNALLGLNQVEEALAAFEKALALDPENVDALFHKGRAFFILSSKHEEALAIFEHVLTLDPDNADAWSFKGLALRIMEQPREALAAFEKALALDPKDADSWKIKGMLLTELEHYEEALTAFNQALALNPDNAETIFHKGSLLYLLERYEEALTAFNQALTLNPDDTETISRKGYSLYLLERYEEALIIINQLLTQQPDNPSRWYIKGHIYFAAQQFEDALTSFNQALKVDPSFSDAWFLKGLTLQILEKPQEGLLSIENVLNFDPNHSGAITAKGEMLFELKRYHEALAAFNQALALEPDDNELKEKKLEVLQILTSTEEKSKKLG